MSAKAEPRSISVVLANLAKRLSPAPAAPESPGEDALVHLLIYSFMLWESTPKAAHTAMRSLAREMLDVNELRVALPQETASICSGKNDRSGVERAARMRAVLNDVFAREHAVSLARAASLSKRDGREYLDSLEGMPAFVAARVTLHGFGGHAIPVDDLLHSRLRSVGVIDDQSGPTDAERLLERKIRAGDAVSASLLLEAWRDAPIKTATESGAGASRGAASKGGRKSTQRKPAPKGKPARKSTPKRSKKDS